jgi:hypothetical protein
MSTFAPAMLPDSEKENLCKSLLDEFSIDISQVVSLRHELIIPCPFGNHQDQARNPTAALNYRKLTFRCLGCGARGGLLWFIAELRGEGQNEARKWLSKETGTDGHVMELANLLRFFDALYATPPAEVKAIPNYSMDVLTPWRVIHPYMTDPVSEGGRGIPVETYKHFNIGYAPEYFMGKEEPTSERIIIPVIWKGKLVGWQSRRLMDDGTVKYKNSPDFPADRVIYNQPKDRRRIVVVESPMSVLSKYHCIPEMGGTFGAGIADGQFEILKGYDEVIFWLDNDEAGWNAMLGLGEGKQHIPGAGERLMPYTNVRVVESPWAADPADVSDATALHLVENAVPFPIWSPPKRLLCYGCGAAAHDGDCEEVN